MFFCNLLLLFFFNPKRCRDALAYHLALITCSVEKAFKKLQDRYHHHQQAAWTSRTRGMIAANSHVFSFILFRYQSHLFYHINRRTQDLPIMTSVYATLPHALIQVLSRRFYKASWLSRVRGHAAANIYWWCATFSPRKSVFASLLYFNKLQFIKWCVFIESWRIVSSVK